MSGHIGPCNNGPCFLGECGFCVDPDVVLPSQLTLTIQIGRTTGSWVNFWFQCSPTLAPYSVPCPPNVNNPPYNGFDALDLPIQPTTWTIPLQAVAPPTLSMAEPSGQSVPYTYFAAWTNSKADYYGGHFPEQGNVNALDYQGYQACQNPAAGATAPYCYGSCTESINSGLVNCSSPGPLTIGSFLGVSAFLGLCPTISGVGTPLTLYLYFLDLQTKHLQSCNKPSGAGFHQGAYFAFPVTFPMNYSASNPFTACWAATAQCSFDQQSFGTCGVADPRAIRLQTNCGSCIGFTGFSTTPSGTPPWIRDQVGYNIGIVDSAVITGGNGLNLLEYDTLCGGMCAGVPLKNQYTLSISGDFPFLNGSYPISWIGCGNPSWYPPNFPSPQIVPIPTAAWGWSGGCTQCTYNYPAGIFPQQQTAFWPLAFTYVVDPPYPSPSAPKTPYLQTNFGTFFPTSYSCSPLSATGHVDFAFPGSLLVPDTPFARTDPGSGTSPEPCNGISSGRMYWTVS